MHYIDDLKVPKYKNSNGIIFFGILPLKDYDRCKKLLKLEIKI